MPTTSRTKDGKDLYLAAYAHFARDLPGNGRSWIGAMRQEGIERFESLGFPSTRDEAWRYTNVAPIATTPFALKPEARADALTPDLFEQLAFEPWECTHLVFINGRFSPELSRTRALPRGVRGDVAAVKAAIEAGVRGAEKVGEIVSTHVIARPHENIDEALPLGRKPTSKKR